MREAAEDLIYLNLPPAAFTAFRRYMSQTGAGEAAAYEEMLWWFHDSEEFVAPYYGCYLGEDRVTIEIQVGAEAQALMTRLATIGDVSLRRIAYTVVIVFLANKERPLKVDEVCRRG